MPSTPDDIAQTRLDSLVAKINALCAQEDVAVVATLFTPLVVCSSVQLETSWSLAEGGGANKLEVHFKRPKGVREDWHSERVQDTRAMCNAMRHALQHQGAQFEAVVLQFPLTAGPPTREAMDRLPGKGDL